MLSLLSAYADPTILCRVESAYAEINVFFGGNNLANFTFRESVFLVSSSVPLSFWFPSVTVSICLVSVYYFY